jgi:hypothetical protein
MSTQTIGMKLDALLSCLDSLPSTHLYALIVAVTVVISFSLLGSGGNQEEVCATHVSLPIQKKEPPSGPEPKWFVLKWLNYFAVATFMTSVVHFTWNAQAYLQDSGYLLRFLIGWSLFLCYFFGFFGISFVDIDELVSPATRYE